MNDADMSSLMRAAAERQLAVAALQKKYEESESIPTEQLVLDMRELLATERVVLDAIIPLPRGPAFPCARSRLLNQSRGVRMCYAGESCVR